MREKIVILPCRYALVRIFVIANKYILSFDDSRSLDGAAISPDAALIGCIMGIVIDIQPSGYKLVRVGVEALVNVKTTDGSR